LCCVIRIHGVSSLSRIKIFKFQDRFQRLEFIGWMKEGCSYPCEWCSLRNTESGQGSNVLQIVTLVQFKVVSYRFLHFVALGQNKGVSCRFLHFVTLGQYKGVPCRFLRFVTLGQNKGVSCRFLLFVTLGQNKGRIFWSDGCRDEFLVLVGETNR
jgi:hypothetical protein